MLKNLWKSLKIAFLFIQQFRRQGCMYYAASLAFNTIFAIVPLVLVGFAILSFFPSFQEAAQQMELWVVNNFVASSASAIQAEIAVFISHSRDLSLANFAALLIIVLLMIYNLHTVVNNIWNIKLERSIASEFLIYLVVLVVSPVLLSGLFLFVTSVVSDEILELVYQSPFMHLLTTYFIPFLTTFISFTVLQWVLPSCFVPIRQAAVSGLITTLLFLLAKYSFVVYLEWFHTYQLLYGALALAPIFLLWIYIVWVIFLLGAKLCYHLTRLAALRKHG